MRFVVPAVRGAQNGKGVLPHLESCNVSSLEIYSRYVVNGLASNPISLTAPYMKRCLTCSNVGIDPTGSCISTCLSIFTIATFPSCRIYGCPIGLLPISRFFKTSFDAFLFILETSNVFLCSSSSVPSSPSWAYD